jgi:hypothetical protein
MQKTHSILSSRGLQVTLLLLAIVIFQSQASAQNIQYTDGNIDQSMRGSMNVDPSTLSMSFNVTLGNYPGRNVNLPVTLSYGSKLWRLQHASNFVGNNGLNTKANPKFAQYSAGGWTTSLDIPYWDSGESLPVYDASGAPLCLDCDLYGGPSSGYFIDRIYVHLPDGSTHEMRKDDTPILRNLTDGAPPITGAYVSVDGSRMTCDVDQGILYMPDGSRYLLYAPGGVEFIDRNGNKLTYNLTTKEWTDTLGRAVKVVLDNTLVGSQTSKSQIISIPGFGNYSPSYVLIWKKLHLLLGVAESQMPFTGNRNCAGLTSPLSPPYLFASGNSTDHVCGGPTTKFNPVVLAELRLPTQQSYFFNYNDRGEITKITLPTGGYYRYDYGQIPALDPDIGDMYVQLNRGVTAHYVCENGGCTPAQERVWTYAANNVSGYKTTVTNAAGAKAERVMYQTSSYGYGMDDPRNGHAVEERTTSASNQLIRRSLVEWAVTSYGSAARNQRVIKQVEILLDSAVSNRLAAMTLFGYDGDLNQTAKHQYDYVSVDAATAENGHISVFSPGALLRTEEAVYVVNDPAVANRQAYRNRFLLALPSYTRIKNAASAVVAETQFKYDEAAYPLLTYGVNPVNWANPFANERGNLTTIRRWLNLSGATVQNHPSGSYIETHAQYDQCGSLRFATDANNKTIETIYTDSFSDGVNRNTFAYPTQVKTPVPDPTGAFGLNAQLTSSTVYEFKSGKTTSTTDANAQTITLSYLESANVDALIRLRKVTLPAGLGETIYSYGDYPGDIYINTLVKQNATTWIEDAVYFDGIGRATRAGHRESATQWSIKDTEYDSLGRAYRVNNPYFAANLGGATPANSEWTTSTYDSLNRALGVTTPDGAVITTGYDLNQMTVTDPAQRKRQSVTDALGRLTQVVEDPGGVGYQTNYTHDTLGNLTVVQQGTQYRYFFYDSLSRLVRAKNPEQDAYSGLNLGNPPAYNNNGRSVTFTTAMETW